MRPYRYANCIESCNDLSLITSSRDPITTPTSNALDYLNHLTSRETIACASIGIYVTVQIRQNRHSAKGLWSMSAGRTDQHFLNVAKIPRFGSQEVSSLTNIL